MAALGHLRSRVRRSVAEFLWRLQPLSTPTPTCLAQQILAKYGEANLVQRMWLSHCESNTSLTLNGANSAYSLLSTDGIDGALLFLFARGGFKSRVCLDLGAGNGVNGNTANLILFHGFKGFMVDGDSKGLKVGEKIHKAIARAHCPVFIQAMLTSSNVNSILESHGVPRSIDLLSLDVDSVDLYILQNLVIEPRVIVLEFNNLWGPQESYSVPNTDGFRRELGQFLYGGASLLAFDKILAAKGYKLVGIAGSGFDAFFVRDNAEFANIAKATPDSLYAQSTAWQQMHGASLGDPIRNKPWVQI